MSEQKDSPKYAKGRNPNSLKNLKPIKPGQVLNPNGRPKGTVSFARLFHKFLEKENDGITIGEALVKKMIAQALKGEYQQQNLIVNRIDGNVPFRIAGAGGDELFEGTQGTIEKIFQNPKAMDLAIKLSNCLDEIEDKPEANGGNNGDGNTTNNK